MAQNVKINGVIYNDVGKVNLPLASDTTKLAVYLDTSDADMTASDIRKGKIGYAKGEKVNGTLTEPIISVTDGVLSIA